MTGRGKNYTVAVLGGGAAGLAAAIAAGRAGAAVVVCERLDRCGKKILASGNGRCNLSNDNLSKSFYNSSSQELVESVFLRFGGRRIAEFFNSLGLFTFSEGGRIFPVTNQSASVVRVLEMELKRLSVPVEYNFEVTGVEPKEGSFSVLSSSGKRLHCASLVMAGGGKSYPALGSDGSVYKLSERLGHDIVSPVPSAVPLCSKDRLCHMLQGQKIHCSVKASVGGKVTGEAGGDMLFTKYGLSGPAILDVSRDISIAINRRGIRDAAVIADMAPFISEDDLKKELSRRSALGFKGEELLSGILPNKLAAAVAVHTDRSGSDFLVKSIKARRFDITGTRGWNEADFTAGGVDVSQVKAGTLESIACRNLYLAGEMLDVDGCRGGYNLAWAWSSGFTAGTYAAGGKL